MSDDLHVFHTSDGDYGIDQYGRLAYVDRDGTRTWYGLYAEAAASVAIEHPAAESQSTLKGISKEPAKKRGGQGEGQCEETR